MLLATRRRNEAYLWKTIGICCHMSIGVGMKDSVADGDVLADIPPPGTKKRAPAGLRPGYGFAHSQKGYLLSLFCLHFS